MPRPQVQRRRRPQVRPDQLEPLIDPVTYQIGMSAGLSENVQELLHPPSDSAQSFNVDIANKLAEFIEFFKRGNSCNFNSAAMVIQGSCLIYGKKVEYLCNLAYALNDCLMKEKEQKEQEEEEGRRPRGPRERTARNRIIDPLCSTEIKPGKNLSCLRRKNAVAKKNAGPKKGPKRVPEKMTSFVPVDLLPLDGEENGDTFYDTRGEEIGNKGDYTLNKCHVTTDGWLLLPTVSPALVQDTSGTLEDSFEDYDSDEIFGTPSDEGYPPSAGCPSSPPVFSSQGTDEGLGSMPSTPSDEPMEGTTPEEAQKQPESGSEDSPMDEAPPPADDLPNENDMPVDDLPIDEPNPTPRPLRRSQRILQEKVNNAEKRKDDLSAVRKPIEKKCTCVFPKKLRKENTENDPPELPPISDFCNNAFYGCPIHDESLHPERPTLMLKCLRNNSKCVNLMGRYNKKKKRVGRKKKAAEPVEEEPEDDRVDEDPVEELLVPEMEGEAANPGLEHDNFDIIRSPNESMIGAVGENAIADEIPMEDPIAAAAPVDELLPMPVMDITAEYNREQQREMENFRNELEKFKMTSDTTEKVRNWKKSLLPFLKEINIREKFNINQYSSRIINAFPDTNRRPSMLFRDFCKDMEKWEIHRYFIALLPLANVGNVDIRNEPREDGSEEDDIVITLLSRKMHHMELEEFGHNPGEHS